MLFVKSFLCIEPPDEMDIYAGGCLANINPGTKINSYCYKNSESDNLNSLPATENSLEISNHSK